MSLRLGLLFILMSLKYAEGFVKGTCLKHDDGLNEVGNGGADGFG